MNDYRRDIKHKPDSEYAWAELGPIPGYPGWHVQSEPSSYPFPTNAAAVLFATRNKADYPDRDVAVVHLDGHRVEVRL